MWIPRQEDALRSIVNENCLVGTSNMFVNSGAEFDPHLPELLDLTP